MKWGFLPIFEMPLAKIVPIIHLILADFFGWRHFFVALRAPAHARVNELVQIILQFPLRMIRMFLPDGIAMS